MRLGGPAGGGGSCLRTDLSRVTSDLYQKPVDCRRLCLYMSPFCPADGDRREVSKRKQHLCWLRGQRHREGARVPKRPREPARAERGQARAGEGEAVRRDRDAAGRGAAAKALRARGLRGLRARGSSQVLPALTPGTGPVPRGRPPPSQGPRVSFPFPGPRDPGECPASCFPPGGRPQRAWGGHCPSPARRGQRRA